MEESGIQLDRCTVSKTSLGTSRIAVKYLGRVCDQRGSCGVSRKSLGDQQDSCEVSRKRHRTSRIAGMSLGRVLGTSRIAVKSLGSVWGPTGSGDQQYSC